MLAVTKAASLIVLLWMVSCSGRSPASLRFPSPGGGSEVRVLVSEDGNVLTVTTGIKESPNSTDRWSLFGEGFRRVWLGWSASGNRVSMLTCSEEFGERIDRFTLVRHAAVDIEKEQVEFREADTNLEESLKDFASSSPIDPRSKDETVFSWFCAGYGDRSFAKFLSATEFVIPPYVKKR